MCRLMSYFDWLQGCVGSCLTLTGCRDVSAHVLLTMTGCRDVSAHVLLTLTRCRDLSAHVLL